MVIKVEFNEQEIITFNFKKEILKNICGYAGGLEKIGYLFYQKLLNINEYILDEISEPHKKDISTKIYSEICWRHKWKTKKWIETKKKKYGIIGYYHTHPEQFKIVPSNIDFSYFNKNSKKANIKVYIIAISKELMIYFYSYGKEIMKKKWILE